MRKSLHYINIVLRFGIFVPVLVVIIVFTYLALPCSFRDIDCGENGQCENMFNDHRCSCGEGALKIDENPKSACIKDYCFNIDCGRGDCQVSSNDYFCQCESGLRFIDYRSYLPEYML